MMEKEVIEQVKQSVDLVSLIRSRGIELKRSGRSYKGLCPFHSEKEPSFTVSPKERLWQCFGCGAGGDAIRFVELFDRVGFKEALEKLAGRSLDDIAGALDKGGGGECKCAAVMAETRKAGEAASLIVPPPGSEAARITEDENSRLSPRQIKLLTRVVGFYHTAFCEDARAREYLLRRGLSENGIFSSYNPTLPVMELKLLRLLTPRKNS